VSKGDILRALAERLELDYRDAMWGALVARGTASDRLRIALERLCDVSERNLGLLDGLSAPTRDAIYHESGGDRLTRNVFVEPLERLLLDGAADGSLAAVDARETATVLFNAVGHTYRHLRTGHGWELERARAGILELVMSGLVAR
jgi:AcrR family transcriptional regulator